MVYYYYYYYILIVKLFNFELGLTRLGFCEQVREVLKHIKDHPFPAVTIFPDNRPHFFQRDRLGAWVPAELPNNNDSTPDANLVNSISIMATTAIVGEYLFCQFIIFIDVSLVLHCCFYTKVFMKPISIFTDMLHL